jgi:hypothetical protein
LTSQAVLRLAIVSVVNRLFGQDVTVGSLLFSKRVSSRMTLSTLSDVFGLTVRLRVVILRQLLVHTWRILKKLLAFYHFL